MNYDGGGMAKRTYEQRARAEEARRTRARIIDSGIRRLEQAPAEPISIERLAADAGVARSTVYAIFGSRSGLFDAIARDLADRSGPAMPMHSPRLVRPSVAGRFYSRRGEPVEGIRRAICTHGAGPAIGTLCSGRCIWLRSVAESRRLL